MDGWRSWEYGTASVWERKRRRLHRQNAPPPTPLSLLSPLHCISLSLSLSFFVFAPLFSYALPLSSSSRASALSPTSLSSRQITHTRGAEQKWKHWFPPWSKQEGRGPKRRARFPTGLCLWTSVFVLSSLAKPHECAVHCRALICNLSSDISWRDVVISAQSVCGVLTQSVASQRSLWWVWSRLCCMQMWPWAAVDSDSVPYWIKFYKYYEQWDTSLKLYN